jgi:nucleoside-diphosphate-sugar epimerase
MTTFAITGATGYVGDMLARRVETRGFDVIRIGRSAKGVDRRFALNEAPPPDLLAGADALIHCAWDVHARSPEAHRSNVEGAIALLDLARSSGVRTIIFVSSMAAYPGCRSTHGRTKLEVERVVAELGGTVIRPGLLYGGGSGGLFGTLAALIKSSRLLPLVGGTVKLPLLHIDDLAELVCRLALGEPPASSLVSAAYPERVAFQTILRTIAISMGRGVTLVPVPATLVLMGLKMLERGGLSLRTGSDNLISLLNQNPGAEFPEEVAGIRFRPFNTATMAQ